MTNRQEDKIQMQRRMQSLYKKAKYQSKQNSGNSYYQDLPVFWKNCEG
ncbi:hypothetical protein [Bacillus sp. B1-b2]|nr:hypothetical protein [Bacillus sp. B1-b2]